LPPPSAELVLGQLKSPAGPSWRGGAPLSWRSAGVQGGWWWSVTSGLTVTRRLVTGLRGPGGCGGSPGITSTGEAASVGALGPSRLAPRTSAGRVERRSYDALWALSRDQPGRAAGTAVTAAGCPPPEVRLAQSAHAYPGGTTGPDGLRKRKSWRWSTGPSAPRSWGLMAGGRGLQPQPTRRWTSHAD